MQSTSGLVTYEEYGEENEDNKRHYKVIKSFVSAGLVEEEGGHS